MEASDPAMETSDSVMEASDPIKAKVTYTSPIVQDHKLTNYQKRVTIIPH